MLEDLQVDHSGEFVIVSGPECGKIARLVPEAAIIMGHALFDAAEKALRATGKDPS